MERNHPGQVGCRAPRDPASPVPAGLRLVPEQLVGSLAVQPAISVVGVEVRLPGLDDLGQGRPGRLARAHGQEGLRLAQLVRGRAHRADGLVVAGAVDVDPGVRKLAPHDRKTGQVALPSELTDVLPDVTEAEAHRPGERQGAGLGGSVPLLNQRAQALVGDGVIGGRRDQEEARQAALVEERLPPLQ